MNDNLQVVSRKIIMPLLVRLYEASNPDEAMRVGIQLRDFVVTGEPREVIYVFAYESWNIIGSILRLAETKFSVTNFGQLPEEAQTFIAEVSIIWETLFRKFPQDMSRAFFEIFYRSDTDERKRLTSFAQPISWHLGRDIMDLAKEYMTTKR